MKTFIITVLVSFIFICNAFSEERNYAVHISNPLGMFQKAGVKLEYRTGRVGALLTGTNYFGVLPKYSGAQGGGEFRLYSKNEKQSNHEKFLYLKVNVGHIKKFSGSGEGFNRVQPIPEGNYFVIGAGYGKRFNFNRFFADLNGGLNYSVPDTNRDQSFYITGPGSFLDLKINLGYKF